MNEYMPTEKEMLHNLIDRYADLQRIKRATDMEKEINYQLMLTKAKLESMGIVTEQLELE